MSFPTFGVNDAMAVKSWSKVLSHSARDTTPIAPLMGEDENSIIQVKTETNKNGGDTVTFALLARLQGRGYTEGQTAVGNAEEMSLFSQSASINEIGKTCAPPSKNSIDAQRIPFDLRDQAKGLLGIWFGERWSTWFFNQVCGYTPETEGLYYGFNAPVAPSAGRHVWAGGNTNDEGLDSGDKFTLELIDYAVEKARVGAPMVRPVKIGGEDHYVMYLHDYQVTDLRTNSTTGQWQDIQKAALSGGQITKNPIFNGALGKYNNVILRRSQDVTNGVRSDTGAAITTVKRAVLLGAQAAVMGFGRQQKTLTKYRWSEEMIDHGRKLEVGGWAMAGMKKTRFNSADFGVIVVSTYGNAH